MSSKPRPPPKKKKKLRNLSGDELQLGVTLDSFYARAIPSIEGAQWTGVVTSIAIAMLETKAVDAVICVQSDPKDRLAPLPVVARSKEEVLASRGVKPSLSPNLSVLATVEALGPEIRSLLFIGVGCQVQALRSVSKHLSLDKLFVLGTNCTDNGPREGLRTFLDAASGSPQTAVHYEFMQDYTVHIKHDETNKDLYEKIPYFSLPANELTDVIAPSCYACFDYTNSLADVVVSYMGVPYSGGRMSEHRQHVVVRNERGKEMLAALEKYHLSLSSSSSSSSAAAAAATSCSSALQRTPTSSSRGLIPFLLNRESLVMQTVEADDEAKLGRGPEPAPVAVGNVIASILNFLGPKGIEFAKYSVDYHYLRNWLHVQRHFGSKEKAERHVPEFAKVIVERYDREVTEGRVRRRLSLPGSEAAGKPKGGPRRRRPAP